MKPYSLDLRERVVAALEKGALTQPQIADKYDISLRTVETWARQWRTTGSIAPKPHPTGPSRTLRAYSTMIRQAVRQQPDQTLGELCAFVAAQTQVRTSVSMMCRELQHLNLPRKKVAVRQPTRNAARPSLTRRTLPQDRDDVTPPRRSLKIHR